MTLLVKHLLDHMRDTLGGGEFPPNLDQVNVLNQAGEHLYSMHPWRFAQGRSTLLNLRGTITGENAAWTASTKTLTLSAAFTDYTFVDGDEIEITDGSGTEGFYEIASRTSANAIVLATSLSASNQTDIDFTLQPYSIDLPDDLRDIISIQGTDSIRRITLTTLDEVSRARENTGSNTSGWYGAVSYAGSPPSPILEIGPGSTSNETGALRLFYRSRWLTLRSDSSTIDVPEFMEALLVQIARAFARGYVREDGGSLDARLAEIHAGPIFRSAKNSDGNVQPFYGTLQGGGPEIWRRRQRSGDFNELLNRVSPPL